MTDRTAAASKPPVDAGAPRAAQAPPRRVTLLPRSRTVLHRTPLALHAHVWDLLTPLVVGALVVGGAALLWRVEAVLLLPLIVLTKRAHLRITGDEVVLTWWWGPIPYRRTRGSTRGTFTIDDASDWSDAPAALTYRDGATHARVWCRHPAAIVAHLARAGRAPAARRRP